jgi:DNA-binding MarR family transcriptional regulator
MSVKGYRLSESALSLLAAMYFCPRGTLPQADVRALLRVSIAQMTYLTARLRTLGYLESWQGERDLRQLSLALTPSGKEIVEEWLQIKRVSTPS